MGYNIGEVAKLVNMSPHTLRYYEKEGLISIARKENGLREFSHSDLELLKVIVCLKETNMPISGIKNYVNLCKQGSESLKAKKDIFILQKEHLEAEIAKLQEYLELSKYKIWYYENVKEFGDESDPHNCNKMRALYESQKS